MVNARVQKPYPEKGTATMSPDPPVLGGDWGGLDWVIPPGKCWRPADCPVAVQGGWILVYEVKG